VQVYDTADKHWSTAASLPAPRGGHAAAVLDGRIHVIGGGNSESTIADHSVYDPATNTWSAAAPLPRPEGSPAAVVFGDKLYAIGGHSGASDYGDVYVYDAASDSSPAAPRFRRAALREPSSSGTRSTSSGAAGPPATATARTGVGWSTASPDSAGVQRCGA
jgi:hypothetical protein